jgi:hypothetical protein
VANPKKALLGASMVPQTRVVPVTWAGIEELPILLATSFATSLLSESEILLAIGQAAAPIIPGDEETQARTLSDLESIEARPLARLVLSPQRAVELIDLLSKMVALQKQVAGTDDKGDGGGE